MPLPIDRPSLKTSLSQRYATQPAGGAFDAKNIIENGVDPLFSSMQGAEFQTDNGFETKTKLGISQLKNDGEGTSIYEEGLDTTPYMSTGIPTVGV
jgi:hypothetical protein